jgi:DNA-binding Lrp family transcriptional regulator
VELDHKDKIILESLMQNCRISLKELSKRTHLTHPAIIYRIKNLEKEYIQRYDGMINLSKFNMSYFIILVSVPKRLQEEFEKHFEKNKSISSMIKHIHKFNYSLNGFITNPNEIFNYLKKRKLEYTYFEGKKMGAGRFSIFDEINLPKKEIRILNKQIKLDKIDIKLIELLQHGSGRDSILELSRKLGINAELTSYRFKRLNKAGYFINYFAQANLEKFNIRYEAIEFQIKGMDFNEVLETVDKTKKLSPFFAFDGKETYFCTLFAKSLEEFEKTIGAIINSFDDKLISFNIYPVEKWIFLNRLNLKSLLEN